MVRKVYFAAQVGGGGSSPDRSGDTDRLLKEMRVEFGLYAMSVPLAMAKIGLSDGYVAPADTRGLAKAVVAAPVLPPYVDALSAQWPFQRVSWRRA